MIKRKNIIITTIVLISSIVLSVIFVAYNYNTIFDLISESDEFHYNAISISSVIGGFLFTGLSILISTIDKERIKRLWDNHYLDNLYCAAIIGMISNVIAIIVSFLLILCNFLQPVYTTLVYIQITAIVVGLVFFVWCIYYLAFIMRRLHNSD